MFSGVFTNNRFDSARMETAQIWCAYLPMGQAMLKSGTSMAQRLGN